MTVRSGLTDYVSQFRSYVQESGTAIFSDDRIQQILDSNSEYFTQNQLFSHPQHLNGSVVYYDYSIDKVWLEGTATTSNKIFNLNGSVVTNYTSDFVNGRFIFDVNTRGTAYYMTGRSFNFFAAVSQGWKEKAAYYATQFDFKVEGRDYKKSQVIQQCKEMANLYSSQASVVQHNLDRGDMTGNYHDFD